MTPPARLGASSHPETTIQKTREILVVQVIENRSDVEGTVLSVVQPSEHDRGSLRLLLLHSDPVEGFANVADAAVGGEITLILPPEGEESGLDAGESVRCRIRMIGPGVGYVMQGTLERAG